LIFSCIDNNSDDQICLLLDEMVSRKHAVVNFHDGAYWLKDLGGLNGSSINGVHAPAFVGVRLFNDDVLEFGATNFRVVFVKGGEFTETVFAEAVRKSPLTVPSSPTHDNQSLRG
jgi:predicted component of type VI protein secretion system